MANAQKRITPRLSCELVMWTHSFLEDNWSCCTTVLSFYCGTDYIRHTSQLEIRLFSFRSLKPEWFPLSVFLHMLYLWKASSSHPQNLENIFFLYFPPREKLFCAWSNVTVSLSPFSRNSAIEWLSHLPTEPMNTIKTVQKSFFFFHT